MSKNHDWRSPASADSLKRLNRAGFAWEFLRRNQEYRAGYERIAGSGNDNKPEMANAAANFARHWGCTVALDPALPAEQANVIWRPEQLPDAVLLSNAPNGFQQTKALRRNIFSKAVTIAKAADGVHALFPWGQQLWQLDGDAEAPNAIVIPLDDDFLLRIAAAIRFNRMIAEGSGKPTSEDWRLTAQHRTRLIQMLRALDGRLSDATYREIASYIFGPGPAHEKGWKTHPVRAQTIRLVKRAVKIVNRGYLKLLRGR